MDVSALIGSITGSVSLARLLVEERDRQKAATIQIDLTDKLIQAQSQVMQVLAAIIEKDGAIQALTERVRNLEAEQSEKLRYQLRELGLRGGFYAYALRPASELPERADEPPHFLCQPCLDTRKEKNMLVTIDVNGMPYAYRCPGCKLNIPLRD